MALSFSESLAAAKAVAASATTKTSDANEGVATMNISYDNEVATTDVAVDPASETGLIVAYSGDDGDWMHSDKYLYYPDYSDDDLSIIDSKKNITINQNQINLTQESNAQYIPFEMDRYYDGFDLMNATLLIHFVNKNKDEDYANPINVTYNDEKIRFAWLTNSNVTAVSGKLNFELQAIGANSKGDTYKWISRPCDDLNVEESLAGNGVIVPSTDWMTSFITNVTEQVALAQSAAQEAQSAITEVSIYAESAANSATEAQNVVDTAKSELETSVEITVNEKVTSALSNYYTTEQVDELLVNIDISDQLTELETELTQQIADANTRIDNIDGLAAFNVDYDGSVMTFYNGETVIKEIEINSDPSAEWVTAYDAKVDSKISTAVEPVQTELTEYKTATDADLESIHSEIDGLPETLQNDYYNKETTDALLTDKADTTDVTAVETELSSVKASVETNKTNINTVSEKLVELETTVNGIDQSPKVTYDMTYVDNKLTLEEIQKEGTEEEVRTAKSAFVITGGSGSGSSTILKIEYITTTPIVATTNDTVEIKYNFSGIDSSGDIVAEGNATWSVDGAIVATNIATAGENTFDITPYLNVGTQKVKLSIVDDVGSLVTKTWTVQKIDVRLESSFNDTFTYPLGKIAFDYTPYGAISKEVHFLVDGKEIGTVTTSASGLPLSYDLPAQEHGAHFVEVYMTATVNNNAIESNHIVKDVIWYDASSNVPVIGCVQQKFTARQYDTTNIVYTVYDPKTESPEVTLAVDGIVVSTLTLDSNTQTWQFKSSEVGEHELTITCGETVKTLNVTIEKLDIEINPVTAGLVFDFNPVGKSNNSADRVWSDGTYSMTVSDNFDWVNGGYQIDEAGDQYFCIKAGTTAVIDYQMFADDAKKTGKEMKLIFKTTNVRKADATFLTCIDGSDTAKIGVQMNVHEAYVCASAGSLYLPYCEDRIIEFEFNIAKSTDEIPAVRGWEDGRGTWGMPYSDSHNFTQVNPQYITIGSPDCDVHIYRFKTYSSGLSDSAILSNFIADARTADEMIDRYNRNQIYDENNALTKEYLAEKCPHLKIIGIEAPYFTNNKSDKVANSIIHWLYKGGDPILDNWTCYNALHSGQGTTSNEYGQASRNMDLIMNEDDSYFILGDGITQVKEISLTRTSVPVAYLNIKVNVASQDNANNKCLAYMYNKYQPYKRPVKVNNPNVKDTMEFYNCVVFIRETDPDISTHREFDDCEWHYYSFGNVGDSKKTDNSRLNDPNDPLEHIVEIMDNTFPNSIFPTGVEDESGKPVYPISADQWVAGNTAYDTLYTDPFDESMTYGWRYNYNKKDSAVTEPCMEAWRNFYTFVVTSTDEEFKANLKDYFVVDTALYYYLFTHFFTMIDNRAKNSFWHYGKCEDGVYRYDLCFGYDFDSGLGINNSGELTMSYGYEDTDYKTKGDASTGYAYNGALSVFFCRIRDLFVDELNDMYVQLESAGCWNKTTISNLFNESQNEFPEALWHVDDKRKYQRTFIEGAPRYYNTMMSGPKKWQREGFLDGQEPYMASKHFGNTAVSDQIMFRCNTPTENVVIEPNYDLYITPYADMYISVLIGATYRDQIRAEAGKEYVIKCPYSTMDDTAILIYCASRIQAIGNLASCYIHDNDFSKAERLKILVIGSDVEGYQNNFLTNLGIGNNKLLETLDIQNTPNLAEALNVSGCPNLVNLYAHGSGLTGVVFANGGMIANAELPAITSFTAKNLDYLTNLDITDYNNMATMIIENCDTIDVINMFELSPNINRVRITGIDWVLTDTTLLDRIYNMLGVDKDGYNITQSVLAGKVHVSVMREKLLADYNAAWPDLEITYDTLVQQFSATFYNADGTVLDVQYVDKGTAPVDPVTRDDNPISIPTLESTVSTDYTYVGWDSEFIPAFENLEFTAMYHETTRQYTVRYLNKGTVKQETVADYGTTVFYNGDIPTYTAEESAYKYYLFAGWDQSGYVNGNKDINAVYDSCEYNAGYFDGKDISAMRPVEIYAMCKLGLEQNYVESKDTISFNMGNDYDYDDIESVALIESTVEFTGSNYIDTGIALFDEDRDFVLAIDFEFTATTLNTVIAQCYQTNGSNGFKLVYNTSPRIQWSTSYESCATGTNREIIVLRHVKGEMGLHVYMSNMNGNAVTYTSIDRVKSTITNATLVFGCLKADDGAYENHATGKVHWAKLWYADLGDDACNNLAAYIHEPITLEMCGFKRHYLSNNTSKRCSMTFMGSHALYVSKPLHDEYSNSGGWGSTTLRTWLNNRFYAGIPLQMRQLIKQVIVNSSAGDQSTEILASDNYVYIPSIFEVNATSTAEPYINETTGTIDYITSNEMRIRKTTDGTAVDWWTRSPNASTASSSGNGYYWSIRTTGATYAYYSSPTTMGVVPMISI